MTLKILLADDSVTAQNMGKKILTEAGHQVFAVSNGAAAAKKIADVKPDLVLLDIYMPGYNGLELCEKLRNAAETSKVPVLLTVGRMEPYNPQDGARVKADGVIVKPFEASDLLAAVERLASKIQTAAPQPPTDYERTIVMPPPVAKEFKAGTYSERKAEAPTHAEEGEDRAQAAYKETVEMRTPALPMQKPPDYEATVRIERYHEPEAPPAPAVPAMAMEEEEPAMPAEVSETGEFSIAPAATQHKVHAERDTTPAFAAELSARSAEPPATTIPSYMEQYLAEESASIEPAIESRASQQPTPVEEPAPAAISDDLLVERFQPDLSGEPAVAAAQGLELTSAKPVPEMSIAQESGFEPTLQSSESVVAFGKDPALETDPHRATIDFPTTFGKAEAIETPTAKEPQPASEADDFEARVQAAMQAFESAAEVEPAAPLQPEATEFGEAETSELEPQVSAASEVTSEAAGEAVGEIAEPEYPAYVPETTSETAPTEETKLAWSKPEVTSVKAISSLEVTPSRPEATAQAYDHGTLETDEAVIQQMREAFAALPVDQTSTAEESAPMAMAAAAGAAPVSAPLGRETELEITRALAAAVGGEAPAVSSSPEIEQQSESSAPDANKIAAAVEKVVKRELPSLVWKIMAELDLERHRK